MSPIKLIIARELREKSRSKTFIVINMVLIVLVLAATILPSLLGSDELERVELAVVGDRAAGVAALAQQQAAAFELDLVVTPVADEAAARQRIEGGEADLVLLSDDRVLAAERPGREVDLLDGARRIFVLDDALAEAAVPVERRAELLQPTPLAIEVLGEEDDEPEFDEAAVLTALVAVVFLYGLLIFYGQQVSQGIVQEKQSRVIEVLLATVRPRQLLIGKLVGLGLLGFGQIAAVATAALIGLRVSAGADGPVASVPTIIAAVAWFVLGYALYATMFALAAALVAKVEDLQTALIVPTVLLVGALFVSQVALADPTGALARYAGLLPPVAPVFQPMTIALGTASPLGMAGAALGVIATTAVLIVIAARVHAGAALSTRQRVTLRDALRRSRD